MRPPAGDPDGVHTWGGSERARALEADDPDQSPATTTSAPSTAVGTIVATVAGSIVIGIGLDLLVPVIVAILAGTVVAATVTAATTRSPGGRGCASLLGILAAGTIVASLGLVGASGEQPATVVAGSGVVLAIVLASVGATAAVTGAVGDGAVRATIPVVAVTSLPIVAFSAVFSGTGRTIGGVVVGAIGAGGRAAMEPTLAPDSTTVAVVSFGALVVLTLWTVAIVLPRLPISELVARDRRERVQARIDRIRRAGWVYGTSVALLGLLGAATVTLADQSNRSQLETLVTLLERVVVPLTHVTAIRVALVGVLCSLVGAYLLTRLPWLTRLRHSALAAWLPVLAGGLIAAVFVALVYPLAFDRWLEPPLASLASDGVVVPNPIAGGPIALEAVRDALAPPGGVAFAGLTVVAVLWALVGLLATIWLLGALGLLPDRAAPGALGAGGLVLAAVAAALAGASTLTVAIPVACAIVAWDAASFGVAITDELGSDATVRRPAGAHVTASVVVGAVGVGLAVALVALAERLTVHTGVSILLALTVALLAVWIALKRRATRSPRDPTGSTARDPLEPDLRHGSLGDQPLATNGPEAPTADGPPSDERVD